MDFLLNLGYKPRIARTFDDGHAHDPHDPHADDDDDDQYLRRSVKAPRSVE